MPILFFPTFTIPLVSFNVFLAFVINIPNLLSAVDKESPKVIFDELFNLKAVPIVSSTYIPIPAFPATLIGADPLVTFISLFPAILLFAYIPIGCTLVELSPFPSITIFFPTVSTDASLA